MEAGKNVKVEGKDNNLLELIAADPSFNLTLEELQATMEPSKYVGRAPIQVDKFLANVVNPILEANKEDLGMTARLMSKIGVSLMNCRLQVVARIFRLNFII